MDTGVLVSCSENLIFFSMNEDFSMNEEFILRRCVVEVKLQLHVLREKRRRMMKEDTFLVVDSTPDTATVMTDPLEILANCACEDHSDRDGVRSARSQPK
jgi:hypothetical protein